MWVHQHQWGRLLTDLLQNLTFYHQVVKSGSFHEEGNLTLKAWITHTASEQTGLRSPRESHKGQGSFWQLYTLRKLEEEKIKGLPAILTYVKLSRLCNRSREQTENSNPYYHHNGHFLPNSLKNQFPLVRPPPCFLQNLESIGETLRMSGRERVQLG